MKVLLIVHGIVQGVGYRNFVRVVAKRHGIKGIVRNVSDGSVEIVAVGEEKALLRFEQEIKVSVRYGPQVMHVEKNLHGTEVDSEYDDFLIGKDKKL